MKRRLAIIGLSLGAFSFLLMPIGFAQEGFAPIKPRGVAPLIHPNEGHEAREKHTARPSDMRLEVTGDAVTQPRHRVTVYTTTNCAPCERLKAELLSDERLDVSVVVNEIPSGVPATTFPFATFHDSTGLLRYILQARTAHDIVARIERTQATAAPGSQASTHPADYLPAAPVGAGGTLYAREQIAAAIDLIRWRVGENRPVSFRWDRTGQQSFPLLKAGTDWSPIALLGRSGRVEMRVKDPVNMPADAMGFGYILDGDDLLIDVDQTRFKRVLSKLNTSDNGKAVGIGPGTVLSILGVMKSVWMLLHPQCDVQLGGNVSAVATLVGDTLTVTFDQAPSVRIVALFTFQIAVDRVEIGADRVRVLFGGSRWIRERTFEVK